MSQDLKTSLIQGLDFIKSRPSFDSKNLQTLFITNCEEQGRVEFEFTVNVEHTNAYGTLHGGMISTLVDVCGSIALASSKKIHSGVSTNITVSFLRAATINSKLLVVSECEKVGKNLAFISTKLYFEGKLVAFGGHTKFLANSPNIKL